MKYSESISMAFSNIFSSKMRTFLTMIGIIIGIVSVIVIVGLGSAMEDYIEQSFESMGADTLTVAIFGRGNTSKTVSDEDMYAIVADNSEYLHELSPNISCSSTLKIGNEIVSSTITGVSEQYFSIKDYTMSSGRNLTFADMEYRSNVAVIGEYINQTYFGGSGVGQTIKIDGNAFSVIGIKTADTTTPTEGSADDTIFIPYTTASRMAQTPMSSYIVSIQNEEKINESEVVIEDALYEIFSDDSSYSIINMSAMIDEMQSMVGVLIFVLTAIAGISLLVGGIGIMNIMLVSVTERTKEIGIRKSLGAKEKYIMRQFIIEASTTSALGGIIGIVVGVGLCTVATTIVERFMGEGISVAPSLDAMLISFLISSGIGILFGYIPAKKASLLNPIDALKYD